MTLPDTGELFTRHGQLVLGFAHRMLGNRAEAEDVTQETFLRAHRERASFSGLSAPGTWLIAIARNLCLDRLRGRTRRSFAALDELSSSHGATAAGAPDAVVARDSYVAAIREGCLLATLSCLTPDQLSTFVLRSVSGLSTADTAVVLGRSENAVRVLASRARARLRDFLCQHCSVYDPTLPCHCENLVEFSLARGWIGPDDRVRAGAAEAAIGSVTDLTDLYARGLRDRGSEDGRFADEVRAALRRLDALADTGHDSAARTSQR